MNTLKGKLLIAAMAIVALLGVAACTEASDSPDNAPSISATAIEVESHGHVQLDITVEEFDAAGFALGDIVTVQFDDYYADMPYFNGYYTNPGETLIRGKAPAMNLALCINYGNFSKEYDLDPGDEVTLTLHEEAGALDAQNFYNLQYAYDREAYESDEIFANFRSVTTGEIAEGVLYRSSSPIDNAINRASYAEKFLKETKAKTVINLADSDEEIQEYFELEDFSSTYYQSMYEGGHVLPIELTGNFFSDEFAESLVDGFEFMADNEGPYFLHCTEGKDRTGFAVTILSALMGASFQEIIDEYILSFKNYYQYIGHDIDIQTFNKIIEKDLFAMLRHIAGLPADAPLEEVNFEEAATNFLLEAGMDEEKLEKLKENLS